METQQRVQLITDALASVSYPITAGYIAKLKNLDKSAVNRTLHSRANDLFEKLECVPPLWRLRLTAAPAAPTVPTTQEED